MDASKQTDTIIEILEENKASDITKIDVQHLTSTVDFMVIANGTSTRHIKALSEIVLRESKKINEEKQLRYNLAASFQNTINKILYKKTEIAIKNFKEKTQTKKVKLIVAGGVAANISIRENLSSLGRKLNFETIYPDLKFCGDNAAMIAWAGIKRFKKNLTDNLDISARSRWPLDKDAPYMKGPGLKL